MSFFVDVHFDTEVALIAGVLGVEVKFKVEAVFFLRCHIDDVPHFEQFLDTLFGHVLFVLGWEAIRRSALHYISTPIPATPRFIGIVLSQEPVSRLNVQVRFNRFKVPIQSDQSEVPLD